MFTRTLINGYINGQTKKCGSASGISSKVETRNDGGEGKIIKIHNCSSQAINVNEGFNSCTYIWVYKKC